MVNKKVEEIMAEYNCGISRARYILMRLRNNQTYKPHKQHFSGVTQDEIAGYELIYINDYPHMVHDRYIQKCMVDSSGHYAFAIKTGKRVALASYVWLKANPDSNIEQGYIINHNNNDPKDNDINNLTKILATENTTNKYVKGGHGWNQYSKGKSDEEIIAKRNKRQYIAKCKTVRQHQINELRKQIKEHKLQIHKFIGEINYSEEKKRETKNTNKELYLDYCYGIDVYRELIEKEKKQIEELQYTLDYLELMKKLKPEETEHSIDK